MELRKVSSHLANALEHLKTLGGLLPICAWCKNVRDDHGYWTRVETYIAKHSDSLITSGICPACYEKLRKETPGEEPQI
jgi:hypothetical protein